ncbi:hypothetical protein CYMTET_43353 [Cymbomonas tetramitiformis]|uniref:Uncharacterized protein n=1 Tax=Cymbomonas tetramitiformis TaxID=36881 RepID=A0AAE0C2B8_9CHLO|nr:hypothetical protein CYMTET_43353 [Cymbomonas tetramitiformis]
MSQDRAARKQAMIYFGLNPTEVEADEEIDLDDTSGDEEEELERPTASSQKRKLQKGTQKSRNVKPRNDKTEKGKRDIEREEMDEDDNDEEEDDEEVDEDDDDEEDEDEEDEDEEEEVDDDEDEVEEPDDEEDVEDEDKGDEDEEVEDEDEQRDKNSAKTFDTDDSDDDDEDMDEDSAPERKRKNASTVVRRATARKTGGISAENGIRSRSKTSNAAVNVTRVSQMEPTSVRNKGPKSAKPTSATAIVTASKSTKKQPPGQEIAPSAQHGKSNESSGFGNDLDALFSGNTDFVDGDLEEAMQAVGKAHNPKETNKTANASQSADHGKSVNAKTVEAPVARTKSSAAKHPSEARKLPSATSNEPQSVAKSRKPENKAPARVAGAGDDTDKSKELRVDSKADSVYDFTNNDSDVLEYDEVVLKGLYKQGDYRMCAEQTCANPKPHPRSVNVDSFTCWRVSPPTLNAPRNIVFYDFRLMRLMASVNETSFFEVKDHEATSNQLLWRNEMNRIADNMSIDEGFSQPMRDFIKEAQYYSLVTGDMQTDGDADTTVVSLHINTSRVLRDYMLYLMLEEINNNPSGGPLMSKEDKRVSCVLEQIQHLHKRISERDADTTVPIVQHVLDFCDRSGRRGQRLCGKVGMYLLPEINVVRKLALAPRDRVYLGQYLLANDIADGVCKQHAKEDATKMMRRMFGAFCYLMAAYETSASAAQN